MSDRDAYFARVAPLLGQGLAGITLAAHDLAITGRVVELLASCMLRRVVSAPDGDARAWWQAHMAWKNGFAPLAWLEAGHADAEVRGELVAAGQAPHVLWDRAARRVTLRAPAGDAWAHQNLTYAVARHLRDALLGRGAWPDGVVYHGCRLWPFTESPAPPDPPTSPSGVGSRAHVLVVGAGSVGSEVLRLLARGGARFTLIDDARVTVFNPHRQWYGTGEIGVAKVDALARRIGPTRVRAIPERADTAAFGALLDHDRPDAVLLATGTRDDAELAQALTSRGIPHVASYAYPQARFFEVVVVEPGTPTLDAYRGHLFRGTPAALPMSDETARFLYAEPDDARRARAYRDLVAEPAAAIETGRIADVAWLCLTELLAPRPARSPWFARMLAAGTTCLLGGNAVEPRDGDTAYGLTYPGQVVRLGVDDIAGAAALPEISAADADAALLS